jgi:hypothetical protein
MRGIARLAVQPDLSYMEETGHEAPCTVCGEQTKYTVRRDDPRRPWPNLLGGVWSNSFTDRDLVLCPPGEPRSIKAGNHPGTAMCQWCGTAVKRWYGHPSPRGFPTMLWLALDPATQEAVRLEWPKGTKGSNETPEERQQRKEASTAQAYTMASEHLGCSISEVQDMVRRQEEKIAALGVNPAWSPRQPLLFADGTVQAMPVGIDGLRALAALSGRDEPFGVLCASSWKDCGWSREQYYWLSVPVAYGGHWAWPALWVDRSRGSDLSRVVWLSADRLVALADDAARVVPEGSPALPRDVTVTKFRQSSPTWQGLSPDQGCDLALSVLTTTMGQPIEEEERTFLMIRRPPRPSTERTQ